MTRGGAARGADDPPAGRVGASYRRRDDVLRVLRDSSGALSIAEVARQVRVHPNTARFHLAALVRSGQAQLVPSAHASSAHPRPGRPAQLFRAVPGMDPSGPRHYRLLAEILATTLASEPNAPARAIAAGHAWGLGLSAPAAQPAPAPRVAVAATMASAEQPGVDSDVAALVAVLDDLGFAPEPRAGGRQIGLRSCPFLDVARARPDVVCPLHLGLMQGALAASDAAVTVDRLEAFVEPDLCLAHLTGLSR